MDNLLILIVFFFMFSYPVFAQTGQFENYYQARTLFFDAGRPYTTIVGIFQDEKGLVWVSTYGGGLICYDGNSNVLYNTKSSTALSSNFVTITRQDNFNRLWVGGSEGIDVIDLKTLKNVPLPEEIVSATRSFFCSALEKSSDGSIWFNANNELYRVSFDEKGDIDSFNHISGSKSSVNLRYMISDVAKDGSVWSIINSELCSVFYSGTGLSTRSVCPDLKFAEAAKSTAFFTDDDTLWMGTSSGLYKINLSSFAYEVYRYSESDPNSISNNDITDICKSTSGDVFVATAKGLNRYDPSIDGFVRYFANENLNGENLMLEDNIHAMASIGDQVWIGSNQTGVSVLKQRRLRVFNIPQSDDARDAIPQAQVISVLYDSKGKLWAGLDGVGLSVSENGKNSKLYSTSNSQLYNNAVTSMAEDGKGHVWLGNNEGKLNCTSVDSPSSIIRLTDSESETAKKIDFICDLCYDALNGYVWICSRSGLFYYDIGNSRFVEYKQPVSFCSMACIDEENHLWVCHKQGLLTIDLNSNRQTNHRNAGYCSCATIDSGNNIWIGTFENGIEKARINPWGEMTFQSVTSTDGLADDRVRSITEAGGFIWVATEKGLSRIGVDNGEISSFFVTDGLVNQTFWGNATAVDRDGKLYLGHKIGISIIDTGSDISSDYQNSILKLTYATTDKLFVNLMYEPGFKISESNRNVFFEFADISFSHDADIVYYARLYPMEKEWRRLKGEGMNITYGRLPGGHYRVQVRAEDRRGNVLSEDGKSFNVRPFFYKTPFFYIIAVLFVLEVVYLVIQYRTKSLENARLRLQEEVDRQTALLNEQKKELALKAEELSEQNSRLLRQNEALVGQRMLNAIGVPPVDSSEMTRFMDRFMATIQELYKDPDIDVESIAGALGMSRSGLNNKVQIAFNQSIGQFLRTYRLNVAKEIINNGKTGSLNINDLAYDVGFNDPKYFTRCFTKEFGLSPSAMISQLK